MEDSFNKLKHLLLNESPMYGWNAHNLTADFFKLEMDNPPKLDEDMIKSEADEDIEFLDRILQVYHDLEVRRTSLDWSTNNLGTFFVNLVLHDQRLEPGVLHDMFTLPNERVSLPDIAFMYSLMDYKLLNKMGYDMYTPTKYIQEECGDFDLFCNPKLQQVSSFKECFDKSTKEETSIAEQSYYRKVIQDYRILPCLDLKSYSECSEYCNWHKDFFGKWSMADFMTIMSFAQPQRKLTKSVTPFQKKFAGRKTCIYLANNQLSKF